MLSSSNYQSDQTTNGSFHVRYLIKNVCTANENALISRLGCQIHDAAHTWGPGRARVWPFRQGAGSAQEGAHFGIEARQVDQKGVVTFERRQAGKAGRHAGRSQRLGDGSLLVDRNQKDTSDP